MKFAYADPPYPGCARSHYGPDAREVNREILIGTLIDEAPNGWVLSTHVPGLRLFLPLCPPEGTRVLSFCKGFVPARGARPIYAWEPVIMFGGRRSDRIHRDWHYEHQVNRRGFKGAKVPGFCFWLFDCLGVEPGDELWDVFPGSGIVSRAFEAYTKQAQEHRDLPLFEVRV